MALEPLWRFIDDLLMVYSLFPFKTISHAPSLPDIYMVFKPICLNPFLIPPIVSTRNQLPPKNVLENTSCFNGKRVSNQQNFQTFRRSSNLPFPGFRSLLGSDYSASTAHHVVLLRQTRERGENYHWTRQYDEQANQSRESRV